MERERERERERKRKTERERERWGYVAAKLLIQHWNLILLLR